MPFECQRRSWLVLLAVLAASCGDSAGIDESDEGDAVSAQAASNAIEYQAEAAVLSGGRVASQYSGYSGSGYATFTPSSSAAVEWTVTASTAATYQAYITFANGSGGSITAKASVNGGSTTSFSLSKTRSWSTWSTKSLNLKLNAGTNRIRLAAGSSKGLPSIDKIAVVDKGAVPASYALTLATVGSGMTSPAAGAHAYASGTTVALTATPSAGYVFQGWSGAVTGSSLSTSIVMSGDKVVTATFAQAPSGALTIVSFSPSSGQVGASVTISGTAFDSAIAKDTVQFNGVTAQVIAASATSLTVTVPSGATTGRITVTVGGQTVTSASNFTVTSESGGCTAPPAASTLVGWATVSGNGVTTTSGGGSATPVVVTTLAALSTAAKGTDPAVIYVKGVLEPGTLAIGSNKTIVGLCGAEIHGHVKLSGSVNVIVRNIKIVGYNCTDPGAIAGKNCSDGLDAVTVQNGAHHLWFDHVDVSDGSDGNFDITHAVDNVTVSWSKFHYSSARGDLGGSDATGASGHRFSNLIGHSDSNAAEDTGHLRITFHHNWWGENVVERQPRVRFGQVHLFNNLWSSSGDSYCIGVGVGANILNENNAFVGVKTPINTTSYVDTSIAPSSIKSNGNSYSGTSGAVPADLNAGSVFSPPYSYSSAMTSAASARSDIETQAGPK